VISPVDFPVPHFYSQSTRSPLVPHRPDFLASLKLLFFLLHRFCRQRLPDFASVAPSHARSARMQSGLQSSVFAATVFPARDSLHLGLLFLLAAGLGSSLHDGTTLRNRFEEQICFPVSRAPPAQVSSSVLLASQFSCHITSLILFLL
jgi:hypothetical protein